MVKTLCLMDGFDSYSTDADMDHTYRRENTSFSAGNGRFGGGSIYVNGDDRGLIFKQNLLQYGTYIKMGFAFKVSGQSGGNWGSICMTHHTMTHDVGNINMAIGVSAVGELSIHNASSILTRRVISPAGTIQFGQWYYMEVIYNHANSGFCRVYLNGVFIGEYVGDFLDGSFAYASLGSSSAGINYLTGLYFDDWYIEVSDADDHVIYGDIMIEDLQLNGDTAQNDFGGSYTDLLTDDGDTTHVSSDVVGSTSEYEVSDVQGVAASVLGVSVSTSMSKSNPGGRTGVAYINSGGSTQEGSVQIPSETGYITHLDFFDVDPNTGSAWTKGAVNALRVGIKVKG